MASHSGSYAWRCEIWQQRYHPAGVQFIYPVHLNPNVRKPVNEFLAGLDNLHLIEPVDYFTMVHMMKRAALILTDSGGIQEKRPASECQSWSCATPPSGQRALRPVSFGWWEQTTNALSARLRKCSTMAASSLRSAAASTPYGDGHAAERIVGVLLDKS